MSMPTRCPQLMATLLCIHMSNHVSSRSLLPSQSQSMHALGSVVLNYHLSPYLPRRLEYIRPGRGFHGTELAGMVDTVCVGSTVHDTYIHSVTYLASLSLTLTLTLTWTWTLTETMHPI
ncbi:hypothetical protein F5Y17DRAFT_190196 [Xylariaceae sp. FL0594]|nr:hypothetical protein F5Y17DRAFT_190196 [Xylariaceae sp. FL0594]